MIVVPGPGITPSGPSGGPHHVAIIMDGNGRWAQQRGRPRTFGHRAGVNSVRSCIETCGNNGVEALTLFAFSSENWRRPASEVKALMELFLRGLDREVPALHEAGARLRFIGDRSPFSERLVRGMENAERLTAGNQRMTVVMAVNYGGRWDLVQACQRMLADACGDPGQIDESRLQGYLSTADLPEPDLFVRTGGEQRISNFMLWQMAYTELYFSPVLWPDFDGAAMQQAIDDFRSRQRRFGMTAEQIAAGASR